MKLDTHVHTVHSGKSTLKPLDRLLLESYNSVEGVYRTAKARGMDLVAITDHDMIEGALIARRGGWEVRVLIGRDLLLEERCARADDAFSVGERWRLRMLQDGWRQVVPGTVSRDRDAPTSLLPTGTSRF